MSSIRILSLIAVAGAAAAAWACAPQSGTAATPASSTPSTTTTANPGRLVVISARPSPDTSAGTLIPAGYGSLKQDDISITLQPTGVRVTMIPLDESVIRVLAPDSYRTLRTVADSRRQQIMQRAAVRGVRNPRVWYVAFTGLVPDAQFDPTDVTVTSGGRDYRPFDVIALTPGFGEHRLQPREVQRCLLLFDEQVDISQPVDVAIGAERNTDWSTILQKID
ncbi:MAG TPA: hypothetical protein VHV78_16315, partial [Gemmatimonadaceae bacterium]|nr:hypothetical protein [Gemmatimonadaceae bacterium]